MRYLPHEYTFEISVYVNPHIILVHVYTCIGVFNPLILAWKALIKKLFCDVQCDVKTR